MISPSFGYIVSKDGIIYTKSPDLLRLGLLLLFLQ